MIEVTDTSDSLQSSSLCPLPFSVRISTLWGKAISSSTPHIHTLENTHILEHWGPKEYIERTRRQRWHLLMGIIRLKSGRWNYMSGGADDNHQSECNDYELENMLGVSTFYYQGIFFFTVFVTVSKLLTMIMIITPYLWYFRVFIGWVIFWAMLWSSSSWLSFSSVSQVFLCSLRNFDPCFQSGGWCFMTHVLHVFPSLSR